jgi:ADP-ribose pyrophosphatase YjhB (NUDIX family)
MRWTPRPPDAKFAAMTDKTIHDYNFKLSVPEGDNRHRHVCDSCGWIHYVNPKVIVGAVCMWGDQLLLCKRAIEPRYGYWTIPAGFMEEEETTQEGAAREAWEEACADIEIGALLGVYNIPRISQVHMIYRATLKSPDVAAGEESLEVKFVDWDQIPWDELAFPSVRWALKDFEKVREQEVFQPFDSRLDAPGVRSAPRS